MSKVLLVDDLSMFLDLQKSYLQPSAVKILTAQNGMDALDVCRSERPALVFMDLHMPVMSGADCCRTIKSDPQLSSTRVVLISSEGKEADRAQCLLAGCDEFMTKPLDRTVFLDTARRQLPIVDRRNTRISCRIKANYRAHGIALSGYIMDVSQHGLYLGTDRELERGAVLDLVFALPEPDGCIVQTQGEIAWLNTRKQRLKPSMPEGFGMRFISMHEEGAARLSRFIERESLLTLPVWRAS